MPKSYQHGLLYPRYPCMFFCPPTIILTTVGKGSPAAEDKISRCWRWQIVYSKRGENKYV